MSYAGPQLDADRPDVHNSEVDATIAARNLCGMTHLNTGHVCLLPERHPGGCDFVVVPIPDTTDELRRDGGPVRIRTIEPSDLAAVQALHLAVSDRSNYFRFFGGGRQVALDYLPTLIAPATVTHHGLLAAVDDAVVAVASFEGVGNGVAEVSLLVADEWQHDGIGTLLMEHLASAARLAGLHGFVAETLMENSLISQVLRDLGYHLRLDSDSGTTTTTFDLTLSPRAVEATARRAHIARSAYAMQRGCVEDWSD